jgi:hypothetical protein
MAKSGVTEFRQAVEAALFAGRLNGVTAIRLQDSESNFYAVLRVIL